MTYVEQFHLGFQWADPRSGQTLEVELVDSELRVTGLFPTLQLEDPPTDFLGQSLKARKGRAGGQKGIGKESPEVCFANADSDEKLIDFVRRFGPVVAKRAITGEPFFEEIHGKKLSIRTLTAYQDMQELRNERAIYNAAWSLVMLQGEGQKAYESKRELGRELIREIAARVKNWPLQWEREREGRKWEPYWKLKADSLERIVGVSMLNYPDPFLPSVVDGRIVICELLKCFEGFVFPSFLEMHSEITFGIRPLLYAALRRQFATPRDVARCTNTLCRSLFHLERAGQQFCCAECSRQQRQRTYWDRRGKKLRRKRQKRSAARANSNK
jgi:hypothetical protein